MCTEFGHGPEYTLDIIKSMFALESSLDWSRVIGEIVNEFKVQLGTTKFATLSLDLSLDSVTLAQLDGLKFQFGVNSRSTMLYLILGALNGLARVKSVEDNVHNLEQMTKSAVETPAATPLETRQFTCALCDKQFSSKANLKVHQRIHSGDFPFTCVHCSRSFKQKQQLEGGVSLTCTRG